MLRAAVLALLSTTGCLYSSHQAGQVGLVPPPRATMYDGQPMTKSLRLEGRATTSVTPTDRISGSDANQHSAYVARDVLGGGVFKAFGATELGLSVDRARSRAATPMTTDVATERAPSSGADTYTFSLRRAVLLQDGWSLGLAGDLGWTSVPIRRSDGATTSDSAPLLRAAIVPSYRAGALTVFASLQVTNDIDVPATITVDPDTDAKVSADGGALIPTAGASVRIGDFALRTQLSKPLNTAVDHGAQLELALAYQFGEPVDPQR